MPEFSISIVDYGMGNLASVKNALDHLKTPCLIVREPDEILAAQSIILPGVGAFGEAMENLKTRGLVPALTQRVLQERVPFLGICLGMQLIARESEEKGSFKGLGWVEAEVRRIQVPASLRLPHMGWNNVDIRGKPALYEGLGEDKNFYFVHSYHMLCDPQLVTATCDYGGPVTASIGRGNIWATQFHPEKSHVNGKLILKNFIDFARRGPC